MTTNAKFVFYLYYHTIFMPSINWMKNNRVMIFYSDKLKGHGNSARLAVQKPVGYLNKHIMIFKLGLSWPQ